MDYDHCYTKKFDREQHLLNSKNRDEKRGKGCGIGRKKCHICSGTGKALHKGHGNMKEYRDNSSFSKEDTLTFGDNHFPRSHQLGRV